MDGRVVKPPRIAEYSRHFEVRRPVEHTVA